MKLTFVTLFSCLLVASCQTTWTVINDDNKNTRFGELKFKAPIDWVIYNDHNNNYGDPVMTRQLSGKLNRMMISKDGFRLDIIDIIRLDVGQAFPIIKKKVDNHTLPSELAELYIAEQKVLTGINLFTITRNEPAKLAGQNGFLIQFHFRNTSGLYIEQLTYGFVKGKYYYTFSYRAPSLHFFDANIKDFVQMLETISLL